MRSRIDLLNSIRKLRPTTSTVAIVKHDANNSSADSIHKTSSIWTKLFAGPKRVWLRVGPTFREWAFLIMLGLTMAILSMLTDMAIDELLILERKLYRLCVDNDIIIVPYLVWTLIPVSMIVISAGVARYFAPQAIGSGIPEMKAIIGGVLLKGYLSIKTLIVKMIGICLTIGSGLPYGKEGPFVHISSAVAHQLGKFMMHGDSGVYENESRDPDILAAGCAVGVACTFSSPVGGVLFSIEVTAVYFAVRNYWRGFFGAISSATFLRVLNFFKDSHGSNKGDIMSVESHYPTHFPTKNPFVPVELPIFALMGIILGLAASLFIFLFKHTILFLRRNKLSIILFKDYWFIYPTLVSLIITSITFPQGIGQYMGGDRRFSTFMDELFLNCTWTRNVSGSCDQILDNWHTDDTSKMFVSLGVFQIVFFLLTILAGTMPISAGIFLPVMIMGACFGRMVGEFISILAPYGLIAGRPDIIIYPGIYSVVGAAAFCGAVTRTISVGVIMFELTGQIVHLLPVMIAILIANAVVSLFSLSIYDTIIEVRKLPFIPDIPASSTIYHQITASHIMATPFIIAKDSTIGEVEDILMQLDLKKPIKAFPLVENKESMHLIGSIHTSHLIRLVKNVIGDDARLKEAARRRQEEKLRVQRENTRFSINRSQSLFQPVAKSNSTDNVLNNLDVQKALKDNEKSHHTAYNHIHDMFKHPFNGAGKKKKKEVEIAIIDMTSEERAEWENEVRQIEISILPEMVDPAPFQIVDNTSLFKIHSLFSLLSLKRTYVTSKGKLVGTIGLDEFREAIEKAKSGIMPDAKQNAQTPTKNKSIRIKEDKENKNEDVDFIQPPLEIQRNVNTAAVAADLSKLLEQGEERRASVQLENIVNANEVPQMMGSIQVQVTNEEQTTEKF
ncbi:hypothetical protein WR25_17177 [Diploscapter pachys]|uniref:CBS domain-containing protein n=1 Tax=Diploscapter pachys TaxID=2018661 RepID=A0A2A2LDM0_9BILA|nr:hypothetical protein WR25_17177 [Diploscapter pachys]